MTCYRVSINVREFARLSVSKMSQPGSGSMDVKVAESSTKKGEGKVQEGVKRQSSQSSLIHPSLATVYKLKPEGDLPSEAESSRYDCCAYIIHCADHDKVLITRQNDISWMPYTYLPPNRSWEDSAVVGFCRVLAGPLSTQYETLLHSPPYQTFRCLQLNRLQVPQTFKFIKTITLYFKLKPSSESFKCCQATSPHLLWLPMKSITGQTVANLWGPELVEFCKLVSSADWKPSRCKITEFGLEEAFVYLPRKPACNLEQHMLNLTAITSTEIERLYEDYIDFCFPSYCMSPYAFNQFMAHEFSFETNPSRLEALFRAFNYTNSGWLSFPELLMGLVCFEPISYHGEYRTKFIFRYWDSQQTGRLTKEQLKALLLEINPGTDVESKLEQLALMGGGTCEITEEAFTRAVGSLKFRGTSSLCRSSKPIFATLRMAIACKHYTYSKKTINSIKAALGCVLVKRNHKGPCPTCLEKKYDMACHIAHLDSSVKNSLKKCQRLPQVQVPKQTLTISPQQYSVEYVFNKATAANCIIKLVRHFSHVKGTPQNPRGLMDTQIANFWKLLQLLFQDVCRLLDEEGMCQRAFSPCFIIGDLHGNIEDLLTLEQHLWPLMPATVGPNFVFLGDYVDRGQWGLECALYLLAFKCLCPNKVTLLRGNHEVRLLNQKYTYKKECVHKYGEAFGLKVWEITNQIFDKLPVCSVVDDAIYCAHGGIPHSCETIEQINKLPREIPEPNKVPIVYEILWSDPCGEQEFEDTCLMVGVSPEDQSRGFVFNTKRNAAYKYSFVAANSFFEMNLLTHIVRAHEVAMDGYKHEFGTKCITIFSSSHYCGQSNKCGILLADSQRLRVIVIDTTSNHSATE